MLLIFMVWIGNKVTYTIFDKFEVDISDISPLEQNNFVREITLITCNNSNKKRLIIKAR